MKKSPIVGEHPSRRKRRLRRLTGRVTRKDAGYWLGMHQNNNPRTRPNPSLPYIHMPVVNWDVRKGKIVEA